MIYTRKGNDYTENYWPVAHDVIAALRARFPGPSTTAARGPFSVILDGEICALDGRTKGLMAFGKNMTVARTEREYGTAGDRSTRLGWHVELPAWMCYICFDVVFIEGTGCESLLQEVLHQCHLGQYLLLCPVASPLHSLTA